MIAQNLARVREKIEESCKRSGRQPGEVQLLAVTKNVPPEVVQEGVQAGLTHLGESKVQETLAKHEVLQPRFPQLKWHMIGHLQSNKVNRACEVFDAIQTLDSEKLAAAVNRRAAELGKIQECLIEVKVSDEPSKSGAAPDQIEPILQSCSSLKNLRVKGLMCMAPYFEDASASRPYFAKARGIFEKHFVKSSLNSSGPAVLSMGMSHDFEAAIQEGSTMVRIGTALFGARSPKQAGSHAN